MLAPLPLPLLQKLWLSPGAEPTGTGSPEAGAKAKAGADTSSPAFPGAPARRLMPILEEGAGENTTIMGGGSAERKPLCGRAVRKEKLVFALKRNLDYFRCLNVGRERDP